MKAACEGGRIVNTGSINGHAMYSIFLKTIIPLSIYYSNDYSMYDKLHCSLCIDNRICTVYKGWPNSSGRIVFWYFALWCLSSLQTLWIMSGSTQESPVHRCSSLKYRHQLGGTVVINVWN
jgi:hypothetical protein